MAYENAPIILKLAKNAESANSLAQRVLGGMAEVESIANFWEENGLLFQLIAQNEMHEFVMKNKDLTGAEISSFKQCLKQIAEFFVLCYTESEQQRRVLTEDDFPEEPIE